MRAARARAPAGPPGRAPGAGFRRGTPAAVAVALFVAVWMIHAASPVESSTDTQWVLYTAMSIIREGNLDLDEYWELLEGYPAYTVRTSGGRVYSIFPVGASLLVLPGLLAADLALRATGGPDLDRLLRETRGLDKRIERSVASAVVALTAALLYLLLRLASASAGTAVLLAGIFAFGTSAWSTASRGLWQHGFSMLLLTLGLYLLLLGRARPRLVPYAALPLAFAYVVRPTNAIPLLCLTWFVARRHRPAVRPYLLWGGAVLALFVVLNLAAYGRLLPPYYWPRQVGWMARLPEALAGNLLSPARGLFVFSPVLAWAVAGAVATFRRPDALGRTLVAVILLHWVVVSSFPHWWGGWAFGPRFFTDVLPCLTYLLIPVAEGLRAARSGRGAAIAALFLATVCFSVFVHYRGATRWETWWWNAWPVNVDLAPARLWDWRDLQFLRGLGAVTG